MKKSFAIVCLFVSFALSSQTKGEAYCAFAGKMAINAVIKSNEAERCLGLGCMLDGQGQAVKSFKMTVEKEGKKKSASQTGNALSPEQLSMLKGLPSGSKIIFSEVKVEFKDGTMKTIKDGVYTIE